MQVIGLHSDYYNKKGHQCYKKASHQLAMKTDVCQVRNPGRIRMAALASQKEVSQRDHADFLSTAPAKWCRDKV